MAIPENREKQKIVWEGGYPKVVGVNYFSRQNEKAVFNSQANGPVAGSAEEKHTNWLAANQVKPSKSSSHFDGRSGRGG